MQTIKSVGPYDFRDAKNVDRIVESSHKKQIFFYNTECRGIGQILDG